MNTLVHAFIRITVIVCFGIILSTMIDRISARLDQRDNIEKSSAELLIEINIQTFVIVLSIYFIRNKVFDMPFFNKISGKPFAMYAETAAISLIYLGTQYNLTSKLKVLFDRIVAYERSIL